MQINFLLEESLTRLVQAYLQATSPQRQIILVNSILVELSTDMHPVLALLNECNVQMEASFYDRQMVSRSAQLLTKILTLSPPMLQSAPTDHIQALLQFIKSHIFVTICGNDCIALLENIARHRLQESLLSLTELLFDNRMHIPAYRQQTRLSLYRILDLVLTRIGDIGEQRLLKLVLNATEGEKDPRNIEIMFGIYLKILNKFDTTLHRKEIFDQLEAYYPIDVIEDQEASQSIQTAAISRLLDQCLCHPLFAKETLRLLINKFDTPPFIEYIPTFLQYLKRNQSQAASLRTLLLRLTEPEHLDASDPALLSQLHAALLDSLFRQQTISSYKIVEEYLHRLIYQRVIDCPENAKYIGTILYILRQIQSQQAPPYPSLRNLIQSYIIVNFTAESRGVLLPKLGLLLLGLQLSPGLQKADLMKLCPVICGLYNTQETKILILKILIDIQVTAGLQPPKELIDLNESILLLLRNHFLLKESQEQPQEQVAIRCAIEYASKIFPTALCQILQQCKSFLFDHRCFAAIALWNQRKVNPTLIRSTVTNTLLQVLEKTEEITTILSKQPLQEIIQILFLFSSSATFSLRISNWISKMSQVLIKKAFSEAFFQDQFNQITEKIADAPIEIQAIFAPLNSLLSSCASISNITANPFHNISSALQINAIKSHLGSVQGHYPTAIQRVWLYLKQNVQLYGQQMSKLVEWLPESVFLQDQLAISWLIKGVSHSKIVLKIATKLSIQSSMRLGLHQYCHKHILNGLEQLPLTHAVNILSTFFLLINKNEEVKGGTALYKAIELLGSHRKRKVRHLARCLLGYYEP